MAIRFVDIEPEGGKTKADGPKAKPGPQAPVGPVPGEAASEAAGEAAPPPKKAKGRKPPR